jgi:ABC-type transport system substrate-binding protein
MTYALNRQGIIKDVFSGMGAIPVGPYRLGSQDHDPEIQPLPFDLAKAGDLLREAGWIDTDSDGLRDKVLNGRKVPFEFSLMIYASRPEFATMATIFKEDLLKIGVKMNIEAAEWSLMQKRMHEKDFDAFTGGWGQSSINDPYQLWHSSQADSPEGSNMTGFRNKEADQLIEKLRETLDRAERTQMLRRIHRLIVESYNYAFLATERRPFCYHQELKGVVFSKLRPIEYSMPWWVEAN